MIAKLLQLSIEERTPLVEDLWDSNAAQQKAFQLRPAQRSELDRRLNAYELDKNPGRPASDVLADIRREL